VNSIAVSNANKKQRLDAILSRYGYCSRSEARIWLRKGRVTVNGDIAASTSDKATPAEILIDGAPIDQPNGILALLHKPAGYVCSHDQNEGPTIYDLLPKRWVERNPPVTTVGRLDKDTTGVLLITDVGELVQRWTSPRHKVPKIYEVTVDRDLSEELVKIFASGELRLEGEDKPALPARLEICSPRQARLELMEGKYHQVKRMFGSHGYTVTQLHRSRFGEFEIGDLAPGKWRLLPIENLA
jgi:16S rRNA pseudouridine516 synthase